MTPPRRPGAARLSLVLGGARSGKSARALQLADRSPGTCAGTLDRTLDRLADHLGRHVDLDAVLDIARLGRTVSPGPESRRRA